MSDLIDRQAAIDATWEEPTYTDPINVLTEVRDRIKQLPFAQRWIPCEERLPEDVEIGEEYPTVIFCTSDGAVYVGGYEHLGGKWWYMDTWEAEAKGVVAWMPLPEPWRGEEDETD